MSLLVESLSGNTDRSLFVDFINEKIDEEAKSKRDLPPLYSYEFQVEDNGRIVGGNFGFDNFALYKLKVGGRSELR